MVMTRSLPPSLTPFNDSAMQLISLGEFTILELLRLQRVTVEDLDRIREIFNQVDVGSTGNLTKPMLAKSNLYRGYGSFDEVDLLREKVARLPHPPLMLRHRWRRPPLKERVNSSII
jgi:hypothetical protein